MRTIQTQKPNALPVDTRVGPFRILRPLNESGGMATLYLAEVRERYRRADEPTQVALKIARIDYEDFLKVEAGILARLADDPHIVKIHRLPGWSYPVYWTTDTIKLHGAQNERICYMAMEYVEGISLRRLLQSRHQLSRTVAVGLARQVAAALSHVHSQRIVHLDVKPENILLRRRRWSWLRSSVPEAILCDFGIARDLLSPARVDRAGSPDYLAPEVLMEANPAHKLVSFPADVYMLGEVLYEMLSGRVPLEETHLKMTGAAPPPLNTGGQQLEALIMQALAREPNARYATASDLQRALDALPTGWDAGMLLRQSAAGIAAAGVVASLVWLGGTALSHRPVPTPTSPPVSITVTPTLTLTNTPAPTRRPTVTLAPTNTPRPAPPPVTPTISSSSTPERP